MSTARRVLSLLERLFVTAEAVACGRSGTNGAGGSDEASMAIARALGVEVRAATAAKATDPDLVTLISPLGRRVAFGCAIWVARAPGSIERARSVHLAALRSTLGLDDVVVARLSREASRHDRAETLVEALISLPSGPGA